MKLKIFECENKYAKALRIVICSFALIFLLALTYISANEALANGLIEELINSVGFMLS